MLGEEPAPGEVGEAHTGPATGGRLLPPLNQGPAGRGQPGAIAAPTTWSLVGGASNHRGSRLVGAGVGATMAGAGAGAMVEEVPTGLAAGAADAMAAKAGQPPGDCTSSRGQLDPGTPSPDLAPGNRQRWERRGGQPGFGAWRKVERKLARPASAQPRAATATRPGACCDGGHQRPRTRRVGGGAESPSCRLGK